MNSLIGLQVTSLDGVHGEIVSNISGNGYLLHIKVNNIVHQKNARYIFLNGVELIKTKEYKDYIHSINPDIKKVDDEKRARDEFEKNEKIVRFLESELQCDYEKEALFEKEQKKEINLAIEKIKRESIQKLKQEETAILFGLLRLHFESDFIGSNDFFLNLDSNYVSFDEFEKTRNNFVSNWFSRKFEKNSKYRIPDHEQIATIAAVNGNVQVVARAGSGKTTTLVNRALFLMEHCGVAANQMLMLAFNKEAATEIRKKLLIILNEKAEAEFNSIIEKDRKEKERRNKKTLDNIEANAIDEVAEKLGIALPHIMTFHALAYAMVHPDGDILFDSEHNQTLSREVQNIIDNYLEDFESRWEVRAVMMQHFRGEWERIEEGGYDKSRTEFLEMRRKSQNQSLGGEYVKSYGEKAIADFLFEHDISYKYERNHWWNGNNYRPDFTIFKNQEKGKERGVVIEYFGLVGDKNYDEETDKKRKYWEDKDDWDLIEISPLDVAKNSRIEFHSFLKEELEQYGIKCVKLSEDEIWERLEKRAIDRFTKVIVSFIGRCRKLSLSADELQEKINKYLCISQDDARFLSLVHHLYVSYLDRLEAIGADDFDGLMQKAATQIQNDITVFRRKSGDGDLKRLRYIFVDEYQDFSDLFYRLLSVIRNKNPDVELFCVGDDWQAINGFAGSDLRFFEKFNDYIPQSKKLYISTNYRSLRSIVKIGNILMKDFGKPAIPSKEKDGTILVVDTNKFDPTPIEKRNHPGDIITPCVLRVIDKALSDGFDVVILCRKNGVTYSVNYKTNTNLAKSNLDDSGIDKFLHHIRSFFSKDSRKRITVSTTHKYKGLEKDVVIILDAINRSYPLVHPDWVFNKIFGDSIESIVKEERRLFYVALTRAVNTLIIFTNSSEESYFLSDIRNTIQLKELNWSLYSPAVELDEDKRRLIVQVTKQRPFEVKEQLKAEKYQWHSVKKTWERDFPSNNFDIHVIENQVWASYAESAEVSVLNDKNELEYKYELHCGNWLCLFDKSSR